MHTTSLLLEVATRVTSRGSRGYSRPLAKSVIIGEFSIRIIGLLEHHGHIELGVAREDIGSRRTASLN